MMSQRGCTVRVPDNCDFVSCGDEVLRSDRCAYHLHEEEQEIRARIKDHQKKIVELCKRLAELTTESG